MMEVLVGSVGIVDAGQTVWGLRAGQAEGQRVQGGRGTVRKEGGNVESHQDDLEGAV